MELKISQDQVGSLRGVRLYVGPLLVHLQELDGTFKHTLQIGGWWDGEAGGLGEPDLF